MVPIPALRGVAMRRDPGVLVHLSAAVLGEADHGAARRRTALATHAPSGLGPHLAAERAVEAEGSR
jgi:hypothetical protein